MQVCFDYYIADYYEKPAHSGKKGYQLSENVSFYFLQLLLKKGYTIFAIFFLSVKLSSKLQKMFNKIGFGMYVQITINLIDVHNPDYWYPQRTKLTREDNTGC